jgi:hypothetical protein
MKHKKKSSISTSPLNMKIDPALYMKSNGDNKGSGKDTLSDRRENKLPYNKRKHL